MNETEKFNNLSRHEQEMAIQISEIEKYKYICSEQAGCDIGKRAYFEWTLKYGQKVREWLESLSDEEVANIFDSVPERIKNYIIQKSY